MERSDVPSDDRSCAANVVLGLLSDEGVAADLESTQDYSEFEQFPDVPSGLICTHGVGSVSLSVSSLSTSTLVGDAHNTPVPSRSENVRRRQTIQELIDHEINSCNNWIGELFLDILLDGAALPRRVNVSDYICAKGSLHDLRFCDKKYPSNGIFKGKGWDLLKKDICRSAHSSGYHLYCNGGTGSKSNTRKFICVCGRLHRPANSRCSTGYRTDVESKSTKKCSRKMGSPFPGTG